MYFLSQEGSSLPVFEGHMELTTVVQFVLTGCERAHDHKLAPIIFLSSFICTYSSPPLAAVLLSVVSVTSSQPWSGS